MELEVFCLHLPKKYTTDVPLDTAQVAYIDHAANVLPASFSWAFVAGQFASE